MREINILQRIANGELTAIGWGTGIFFQKRKYIHSFDIAFTINTSTAKAKGSKILIHKPDILHKIDRKKFILIIYTLDYLEKAYEYCSQFDDLLVLPFNDHRIISEEKMSKKNIHNLVYQDWGIFYEDYKNINI